MSSNAKGPKPRRFSIATVSAVFSAEDGRIAPKVALLEALQFRGVAASPADAAGYWVPRSWQCGVYVLDTGAGCLYVGQTTQLHDRLNDHRANWTELRAVAFLPCRQHERRGQEMTVFQELNGLLGQRYRVFMSERVALQFAYPSKVARLSEAESGASTRLSPDPLSRNVLPTRANVMSLEVRFRTLLRPDPILAEIVGSIPVRRTALVRALWRYIGSKGLQDSERPTMINADEKLRAVLGERRRVNIHQMMRLIETHLTVIP